MTREEEIIEAGIEYTMQNSPCCIGGDNFYEQTRKFNRNRSFENGAQWADNHPINVWHDASEEPKEDMDILCISKYGNIHKVSKIDNQLYDWLKDNDGIKKWAYISDLLPKE